MQLGYKVYEGRTGSMKEVLPEDPKVLMRLEKGQALTHLEMDNNLGSLFHTLDIIPRPESWGKEKYDEYDKDQYVQFNYAPITETVEGVEEKHQYESVPVKLHKSIPEVLEGIANEEVPGNLNIKGGLFVTESSKFLRDLRVDGTLSAKKIRVDEDIDAPTMSMDRLIVRVSGSIQELDVSGSVDIAHDATIRENLLVSKSAKVLGDLYVDGTIFGNVSSSQYQPSDIRLKTIEGTLADPISKVHDLHGYNFYWKEDSRKDVGLIAQEVQTVLPEAVETGKDGYLRVDYCKVIPLLVEAIKELSWEVEELKKR